MTTTDVFPLHSLSTSTHTHTPPTTQAVTQHVCLLFLCCFLDLVGRWMWVTCEHPHSASAWCPAHTGRTYTHVAHVHKYIYSKTHVHVYCGACKGWSCMCSSIKCRVNVDHLLHELLIAGKCGPYLSVMNHILIMPALVHYLHLEMFMCHKCPPAGHVKEAWACGMRFFVVGTL